MKEKKEDTPVERKISLIDNKRANQVGIALGKLKMEFPDIVKAIIGLDDSMITLEELMTLKTIIPTPEEVIKQISIFFLFFTH
jgi:hypothetical protein